MKLRQCTGLNVKCIVSQHRSAKSFSPIWERRNILSWLEASIPIVWKYSRENLVGLGFRGPQRIRNGNEYVCCKENKILFSFCERWLLSSHLQGSIYWTLRVDWYVQDSRQWWKAMVRLGIRTCNPPDDVTEPWARSIQIRIIFFQQDKQYSLHNNTTRKINHMTSLFAF